LPFFVIGGGRDAVGSGSRRRPDIAGAVTLLNQRDGVPAARGDGHRGAVVAAQAMAQATLEVAAGRAVVSTDTVGADEAIEHSVNELIVPVGDVSAIAERSSRWPAIQGGALRSGRRRRRIAAHFTQQHTLDQCGRSSGSWPASVADGSDNARWTCIAARSVSTRARHRPSTPLRRAATR
jgi:hypothetical protein